MIIITYRPLYCVFALKLGIPSRKFLAPPLHDVDAAELAVFVDGKRRLRVAGRGGCVHTFKFRVHTQTRPSHRMESRWRDVKVFTKKN